MKDEKKDNKVDLKAIHKEAMDRFASRLSIEKDDRQLAIEDNLFVDAPDGQWDDFSKETRKDKPRYTVNHVGATVGSLVGDQRENRTQIKVAPEGNDGDDGIAQIKAGLIRKIESQSKAANAYDAAYDEALKGGYGGFRVLTEWSEYDPFNQDIIIDWIPSAASSLWFGPSIKYDKRDAPYAFLTSEMPLEEFKSTYPKATEIDFDALTKINSQCSDWTNGENVRVSEYWVKTPVFKNIALMTDGRIIDLDNERKVMDDLKAEGVTVAQGPGGKPKVRKVKSHKVEMYKMSGGEILEGPNVWGGKYIPLIPVFGKVSVIENKTYIRGIVRPAKDPAMIYNYATSASVEATAMTLKDPIWLTEVQAAGHEDQLNGFNRTNDTFMIFNADPENPGIPQRGGAPAVQTALLTQVQQAKADVESSMGVFSSTLGNAPQLLSERSVQSQEEKGDRGAFVFKDNLMKSIQYGGDILLDIIPIVWDTPQRTKILGIDGKTEDVDINGFGQEIVDDETGKTELVNDLSRGRYSATVESGPAYSSLKTETANQLIEVGTAYPILQDMALDLVVKNLPILDSEEVTKRVRRDYIKRGIVEPTDEEIEEFGLDKETPPDPGQVALTDNVNMQSAELESKITINDQKAETETVIQYNKAIEAHKTLMDSLKIQKELGIPIGEIELKSVSDAVALIELARDKVQV